MMPSAIIAPPWKKQCRSLVTGVGFTLAFGWLWFGSLRALWLPGQPSNFSSLVLAGFFTALLCICFTAWLLRTSLNSATPLFITCKLHGTTALFLLGAFFFREQTLIFPLALGMSGAGTGLFWTIALLRQNPEQTILAFASAEATALMFLLCSHLLPQPSSTVMLWLPIAFCPTVAWVVALIAVRKEEWCSNTLACASPNDDANNSLSYRHYFVLVFVFFVFSLFLSGVSKAHQSHVWTHGATYLLGATLAYAAWRVCVKKASAPEQRGNGMFMCALGVFCLANVGFFWPFFWPGKSILVGFLEGTTLGVVAFCFSRKKPPTTFFLITRAALVLALIFFASNGGAVLGTMLSALGSQGEQASSAVHYFIATILFVIAIKQRWIAANPHKIETAPIKHVPVEAIAQAKGISERYTELLTEKEHTIALLILQGFSNKAIVKITGTTNNTVRWHLKNLYRKTASTNRIQLIATLTANDENESKIPSVKASSPH